MRNCPKCDSYVPEGTMFCPACGRMNVALSKQDKGTASARLSSEAREVKHRSSVKKEPSNPRAGGTYEQKRMCGSYAGEGANTSDITKRIFCAAAYFGFFFFLPLIALPNSNEAKFHANQGLILFLFGLMINGIASTASVVLGSVFEVLVIIHPLLMVYGASNAFQGKMVELPLIGKLRILKNYTDF